MSFIMTMIRLNLIMRQAFLLTLIFSRRLIDPAVTRILFSLLAV